MLKKKVSSKIVALVFGIIVICFAVAVYVSAWTEPGATPPGSNVAPPLNVSGTGQSKAGGLIINTGGAANGLIVDQGNVGIGTPTPDATLDVQGTVSLFGNLSLINAAAPDGFASGPVTTDGFIMAYANSVNTHFWGELSLDGITYTTVLKDQLASSGSGIGSITMPVPKGYYYRIQLSGGGAFAGATIYWIPLGN